MFWLYILIVTIVLELLTPSALVSIWFSCGSVIALLLSCLGFGMVIQFIAFFVVSILSMMFVRPLASKYLKNDVVATNADRLVHATGFVTKTIKECSWGEVKVMGEDWSAVGIDSCDIEEGCKIEVIAIEGVKLVVQKIDEK